MNNYSEIVQSTSALCNLPKLVNKYSSYKLNNDCFIYNVGTLCFDFYNKVINKKEIYYLSNTNLYKIKVESELGYPEKQSQANNQTGHKDQWIHHDVKYFTYIDSKKLYLSDIVNSKDNSEFILIKH